MKQITFLAFLIIARTSLMAQVNLNSGLVGCYPFSGNANDYSGFNHHGVVNGATLTTDRFGQSNSAYLFNGTSDYIAVSHFDSLITQDEISISIWSMANAYSSNVAIMLSPDVSSDRLVCAMNYVGGPYSIWDYGDFTTTGRMIINTTTYTTTWEHYVFITSQSGNIKAIYRNGSIIGSSSFALSLVNRARTLYIGGGQDYSGGGIRFHGALDDIRIYNRAINAAEVTALYNATQQATCSTVTGINSMAQSGVSIRYKADPESIIHLQSGTKSVKGNWQIINMLGQIVAQQAIDLGEFGNEEINVIALPKGIYTFRLVSDEGQETLKFNR